MKTVSSIIVSLAMLCLAAPVRGGDPERTMHAGLSCSEMKISVCPAGDFEAVRKGCGGTADYIWIEVLSGWYEDPIPGIPVTDYWLGACDGPTLLSLCAQPILADSATGLDGRTTISGHIHAGGCALTGGIWIAVQGQVIDICPPCSETLCLPIVIKSPDLTGSGGAPDGVVNLSDLIPFGLSYNKSYGQPDFNACCDYNDDFTCNLSDFAYFSLHYQHTCQ